MCGIVGAISKRNIVPVLVQGLQRLEYRGYDSCGVAVNSEQSQMGQAPGLQRARSTARVAELVAQVNDDYNGLQGLTGIAHTRWATHGAPAVHNAHPHFSRDRIALVHNGIIENHEELRAALQAKGYSFVSQTDTEVMAHLIDSLYQGDILQAVLQATQQLRGAFAIAVMAKDEPHRVIGARAGSPLIFGQGQGENFLASDAMALAGVTDQIVYLAEGDVVDVQLDSYQVFDASLQAVQREVQTVHAHSGAAELGPYSHYMQKEIFEQPRAIADTLEGIEGIVPDLFDNPASAQVGQAAKLFDQIDSVLILACGTSYYSGCVAKYWLESIAHIPCQVEVASEYRYRTSVPNPRSLVVTISQSGETA
ncbi:MAG: glutamine--fructose-6-phosphate transaminase (isomerizing), partial [Betaproteobacteria bacterium]|nr:glutamine--fructose-6-phosphate transaminase (isomerizing) [Betaproteobacteria bacterium]